MLRAAEAGIGWIRVDFNWDSIEKSQGAYDWNWSDLERRVNIAKLLGLEIYATLTYTPDWANPPEAAKRPPCSEAPRNFPPLDPQDWYKFVRATVSHFQGRIRYWGLWNEPNQRWFFDAAGDKVDAGQINLDAYIQKILIVGSTAVKAADPNGLVLGPDLFQQEPNWAVWLYEILARAGDRIDIVTHHSYESTGVKVMQSLGQVPDWRRHLTPRTIMAMTGTANKPLWLTETGWHTDGEADSTCANETQTADYYGQVLQGLLHSEWLDKVFFYELKDDPTIGRAKLGIVRADPNLTPKPAWYRYRDFIATHGILNKERHPSRWGADRDQDDLSHQPKQVGRVSSLPGRRCPAGG